MGYGSELLADYEFERDYPFGIPGGYWKTRDGRRMQITEMTNGHIRNCMKIVGEDNEWHDVFEKELQRRKILLEDEE